MESPRILVVDDEVHIREIVRLKLLSSGYEVVTAANGTVGLELATNSPPALIITDYNMPGGIDGVELVKALRESDGTKDVPIVILTGSVAITTSIENQLGPSSGVTFIQKPFSPRALVRKIEKLIKG